VQNKLTPSTGKVWKQSLTELSGGQRSLIAISLIMSLLQFKPAPMYILDEVDAALDLSHTQNIGRLIKTRFKGSQFIVVSLKDGMFVNANRIFRTRFSEGTSMVQALTVGSANSIYLRALLTVTGGGFQVGHASGLVFGSMSKLGVNVCVAYWN
jgi:chromosome segregation ATPase